MLLKNRYSLLLIITSGLLLIPLIAMQFTTEVNWQLNDFLIAGALIIGTGLLIHFVKDNIKNANKRSLFILAIIILVALLWAEMAVGIFGSPIAGS